MAFSIRGGRRSRGDCVVPCSMFAAHRPYRLTAVGTLLAVLGQGRQLLLLPFAGTLLRAILLFRVALEFALAHVAHLRYLLPLIYHS